MRIVKFHATWCEPCKALSKVIERNKDKVTCDIQEVDIDQDMESAKAMGVRGVPTMVLIDDSNTEIRRHVGMMNDIQFEQFLMGRG
jgi:thioredoxin-like negative regulator of GroEL